MAVRLSAGKRTAARSKARLRRQLRTRKKLSGTPERPRLVVTRTSRHLVAQMVDDVAGRTIVSASTMEADLRSAEDDKVAKATRLGETLAERAKAEGITTVVFDRAGNRYHGRVAALADGARSGGLEL
ncbi:MAG: 50S ribosomal protein L18 [Propionibacteriales bacterium]|nr:50S ribosomal protein L18 [Propionibacteriales bacterium]